MSTHTPQPPAGRRRRMLPLIAFSLLAAGALAPAVASGLTRGFRAQRVALLVTDHLVHTQPSRTSPILTTVSSKRPITAERTALPVLSRRIGAGGIAWLDVMLPGRPNSSTGWIAEKGTSTTSTSWRLLVDLGTRRVSAYWHGRLVRTFSAVVGKPSTPTPTGRFFVEEVVELPASEPGGPLALALSARSNVLQEFEGGPGQIGIHGRDGLGGHLGSAESHGCMRLATASIEWLAERIAPGVPVRILP